MRSDYLSWDDYFMSVGFLSSMRSKDPSSQVGACIINSEKIIVSIGYNGMPKGCSDDKLPWNKGSSNKIKTKYLYVCHAEMNAVLNKNSSDVAGCVIYVALFPCNECAKIIIQSRIKEVVYFSDKHEHKPETIASKAILKMAGISVRQYIPIYQTISINFNTLKTDANEDIKPDKFSFLSISDKDAQNKSSVIRDINKKRLDYIAWEEYFMALAFLSALRSKDPSSQTGACIVNTENKIVGIGYNGMPRGCDETKLPWNETTRNKVDSKYTYVCHAVMNAILNKNCAVITGCKIYVSLFPCNECAKFIIQADLKEVIFYSDKFSGTPEDMAAKIMFDMAGVLYRRYNGSLQDLKINFGTIDWNKEEVQLPLTPKDDPDDVKLN